MKTSAFLALVFTCILGDGLTGVAGSRGVKTATCEITDTSGVYPIYGNITLTQRKGSEVKIKVSLKGFNSSSTQKHGFHVHEFGDLGNQCTDAGGHFNPTNSSHGGPNDRERHVGDLGNVLADGGVVETTITDRRVSLFGRHSVIGKSIVVHKDEDDLGRGNYSDSLTTGHAGPRYGCCIITESAATAQKTAYCRIEANSGTGAVEGNIEFTQQSASSNITITVNLSGFEASSQSAKHGFHVHEHGELGNSCSDAGGHYNPTGKTHGGPDDENRHVGDLGNVVVTNGNVETTITDHVVTLYGSHSVMGRSIVVHEGEDDLGLGGHADSNTTGHAGARLGCCKITRHNPSVAASLVYSTLLIMASYLLSELV